jgi:hypothetical protein
MKSFQSNFFRTVLARTLAWGTMAVGLMGSPLMAQDIIGGNFTLGENARFGNAVLGPGQYRFSIEPIGNIQSIQSIQRGVGHTVLVVLRPEKSGPVVSIFAMASPNDHAREGNELVLEPQKAGRLAQGMYLQTEGLVVDFRWSSPKTKGQVVALQTAPLQTAAVSRSGAN